MAEDFLLKWNDHHSLFFSGAERLLREEEFTDVTLAAESKVFRAHKFVLSICSPYFQVNITSYFTLHLLTKKLPGPLPEVRSRQARHLPQRHPGSAPGAAAAVHVPGRDQGAGGGAGDRA